MSAPFPHTALQQPENKGGSKRKRPEDTPEVAFVQLPRDELLKMTSTQLEEYVEKLKQTRPLSVAEQREVKRQRRLIKNREYAHTSRQKKKEFVHKVKDEMDDVKNENERLRQMVTALDAQVSQLQEMNEKLTQDNQRLQSMLGQTAVGSASGDPTAMFYAASPSSPNSPPLTPTSSVEESDLDLFLGDINTSPSNDVDNSDLSDWLLPNPFATGLCLLVVLFSFGFFLNSVPGLSTTTTSSSSSSSSLLMGSYDRSMDVMPSVISTGRHLCETSNTMIAAETAKTIQQCPNHHQSSNTLLSMNDVFQDERLVGVVDQYFNANISNSCKQVFNNKNGV